VGVSAGVDYVPGAVIDHPSVDGTVVVHGAAVADGAEVVSLDVDDWCPLCFLRLWLDGSCRLGECVVDRSTGHRDVDRLPGIPV
jgi:hypothetical protein